MGKLWQEFKTFAFKGNMLDLAIAVIIGGAFGAVINSLVNDLFMPLLAALGANSGGYEGLAIEINGSKVLYGKFLGALINFLLVASIIFLIVIKIVKSLVARTATPPPPSAPTVKECPFCLSEVPLKASRCKFCTSEFHT